MNAVAGYMPILKHHAHRVHRKIQAINPVPFEDCLGEAYVIFCEALQKYDPERKAKFETVLWIYLKNLERKVLMSNRLSSSKPNSYAYPGELHENIPDKHTRIATEELSQDGQLVVSLLINGLIGGDYGTGKGKKMPGRKRIPPYMKVNYGWNYKKSDKVIEEITDWWRTQV